MVVHNYSNKIFAISASQDHNLKVWNLTTQKEIANITLEHPPTKVIIATNDLIIVGDDSGQVHFFQPINIFS